MAVVRISALDNAQQILENLGYSGCVGFQPLKHLLQQRVGVLFYVRGAKSVLVTRTSLSESLPQVSELATASLERLDIPNTMIVRDGASGYPLQCELKAHDSTGEDFELWRVQGGKLESAGGSLRAVQSRFWFDADSGVLRVSSAHFLGQREQKNAAGLTYYFDEQDRCARVTDAFCSDDLS